MRAEYEELVEAYDRAGLPLERAMTRLSYAALLLQRNETGRAEAVLKVALALARAHRMGVIEASTLQLLPG